MSKRPKADTVLNVRISSDLKRRIDEATEAGPYPVSITHLVQRGIELALKELAELRAKQSK
jgi:Arc/MetJ-type ribon-helix-helix transcriptional regulator